MIAEVIGWEEVIEVGKGAETPAIASVRNERNRFVSMVARMTEHRALGWTLHEIQSDEIQSGIPADQVKLGIREIREHETAEKTEETARRKASRENGKKGGRPPAPSHADAADAFVGECLTDDQEKLARYYRGEWYEYHSGGWNGVSKDDIRSRLVSWLRDDDDLRGHATLNYAGSVMLNMTAHDLCGIPPGFVRPAWLSTGENASDWMAFGNGLVVNIMQYANSLAFDVEPEGHTRLVSPDFFSPDFVPYAWEPGARAPRFQAYLERVQPDEANRRALQQMTGLLIADTTRYEAFWQLYGTGQNGKTVLLDIIQALVGKHNVSFVTLPGLIERFQCWPLAESKVNICGELPTDVGRGQFHAIEGAFKDVVSGGSIEVEKKGADKYSARCRARFVMATNSLPTFIDRSDGIWRRLRIIPFAETITDREKDVDLAQHIIDTEMPGIMQWAVRGLADVIRAGNLVDCPAGADLKNKHRMGCDHEQEFLVEKYEKGTEKERVKATDLYTEYKEWMRQSGYYPLGASKFYVRVEDLFAPAILKPVRLDIVNVCKGFEYIRKKEEMTTDDVL